MSLWQIITGNSTLPINENNSFWGHLNNQNGDGVVGTLTMPSSVDILFEDSEFTLEFESNEFNVTFEDNEFNVEFDSSNDFELLFDSTNDFSMIFSLN